MITSTQARQAVDAIVQASAAAGFAVAIAIVDEHGDLIAAHRMDGCRPRSMRMTQRKAYTAAVMDRDTAVFQADVVARDIQLASYGEPLFCALPGGVVVTGPEGATLGAIGVTGNTKNRDAEFAAAGLPFLSAPRPSRP
jgi:glc operon protein GlcG